jgi:ligand-binding SRPBCC domain-containing protein
MAAGSGTRLTIGVRPFPLAPFRIPWEAEIEEFRWNEGFCDVQMRGPFKYWRHCHTVMAAASPKNPLEFGTTLRDHVEYELPLGALSGLADLLVVKRGLAYTFRYRQERTEQLLALATGRVRVDG